MEERSWEARRRDALKPWMFLVRVRRDEEWLRVYFYFLFFVFLNRIFLCSLGCPV